MYTAQFENRVESDSLGTFFFVSRHLQVWLGSRFNSCLAWLVCNQAASIGAFWTWGSYGTWACVGVGEKAEIGEMRECRPCASTTWEESSSCQARAGLGWSWVGCLSGA